MAELYFLNLRSIKSATNSSSNSIVTEIHRSILKRNMGSTAAWALGENFSSETDLNNEASPYLTGKERGILPLVKPNSFVKVTPISNSTVATQQLSHSRVVVKEPCVHSGSALACGLSSSDEADETTKQPYRQKD